MRRWNGHSARAFTLTELFVVIAITAIVVTVAVPSFTSLIRSSERTLSTNSVLVGATVARDIALRDGVDAAAVFLQDEGGAVRVSIVAKAGEFDDIEATIDPFVRTRPTTTVATVRREVFAPVPDAPVLELAPAFGVRGYAPPYSMQASADTAPTWYDSDLYGGNQGVATGRGGGTGQAKRVGNWVAPESGYFNQDTYGGALTVTAGTGAGATLGTPRQSFMLRFAGGTGAAVTGGAPVLVLDARPVQRGTPQDREAVFGSANYQPAAGVPRAWWRVEESESQFQWARRVIETDSDAFWQRSPNEPRALRRARLIGLYSHDTVLCAPVTRVAVYREAELAQGVRAGGVNEITGTLYAPFGKSGGIALDVGGPQTINGVRYGRGVLASRGGDLDAIRRDINRWVSGDTDLDGVLGEEDDKPLAQLFTLDTVTGDLREVVR